MNTIGMASITAFYNLHRQDRRRHELPYSLVPTATVVDIERTCWPTCTPNGCPILLAYLSFDDTRQPHEEVRRIFQRLPIAFPITNREE